MPLILGTNSIKDTGYDVANSLRFDGSSDYLNRNQGTQTNDTKYTFSAWVKRSGVLGSSSVNEVLLGSFTSFTDTGYIRFEDQNDNLQVYDKYGSTIDLNYQTNMKFRDPSAWYHIVVNADSTRSANQRCKIYVNGSEVSCSNTTDTGGTLGMKTSTDMRVGAINNSTGASEYYFSGYMAEVYYIDGSGLDASNFGEFNSDSPTIWQPKAYEGSFGNNGFYLDFENASSLGADVSGNSNNFTVNNLTSIDQTTDTCTNNFCTMNPLDNYYASNTYSEGNIKFVTKASGGFAYGTSTVGLSSGKWYAEFDCIATTDSGAYHQVGIVEKPSASTTTSATANIGSTAYSWGYFALDGKYRNNGSYSTYGDSWTTGDIIGVYLNLDDNELRFSKNGAIQNSGTAISITAPSSNGTGHYFITAGGMSTNASVTFEANFGNPFQSQSSSVSDANGYGAFEYSPTLSGVNYYSINTKNLAEFG